MIGNMNMELNKKHIEIYRPYFEAFNSKTIFECGKINALSGILSSIMKCMEITGAIIKNEQVDVCKRLSELFYNHALIKYPAARLGQIELAFRNGALKEYGDYFGFNLQTLHNWFKSFLNSKENIDALKDYNKVLDLSLKSEVPMHLRIEQTKEALKVRFHDYKKTGKIGFAAYAAYDVLNNLLGVDYRVGDKTIKTLITDPIKRKEIFDSCLESMQNLYGIEKSKAEKKGDFELAKSIGEFLIHLDTQDQFYRRSKEKLLTAYFDELITNNKNLNL